MAGTLFDDLTEVYDALVDWPKRLAHEEPFYRRWFDGGGVRSVVDVACGTGRHAAMFHSWGLRVEGADLSPAMIERARGLFGEPPGLHWTVRGFDAPIRPAEPWDAAICVGNSLALASEPAVAERAVAAMAAAVRPGGLIVVQVLNLGRLPDGPCTWQKAKRATLPQGEAIILKGVHRCGPRGYVELVLAPPDGGVPLYSESVSFLGMEGAELEQMARRAGASEVTLLGGYHGERYEPQKSVDLVMVARR